MSKTSLPVPSYKTTGTSGSAGHQAVKVPGVAVKQTGGTSKMPVPAMKK